MSSVNLLDLFDSKVFSCHGKTSELKTHPQMSWDKSMSTWGPFIYKVMGGGLGEFMGVISKIYVYYGVRGKNWKSLSALGKILHKTIGK